MIKVYPTTKVEGIIRKKAAEAGIPITQLLAPYLNAIADGTLTMVPHFPAPKKDAAA